MPSWSKASPNGSSEWMAFAIHADRVEVAQIECRATDKPSVRVCESYAKRGADADVLKRLRTTLRASRFRCAALLSPGQYQMQLVEAPGVAADELKSAVRWKLKDLLDYPVDQATVDVADVPQDGSGSARTHYVYAVSARNDQIATRMKLFHDARIALSAIDVPEMAQRNIARLFEESGRGLAMLVFGEYGGMLTFTSGGELYMARQTDITLAQLTSPSQSTRDQLLERLVLELQRSLDHFDRQFSYVTLSRLLLAPLPPELGVQEYLADNLYLPVHTFDLADVVDLPGAPELREPERQPFRLHILGAALRGHTSTAQA
jgi:MSHA biogenesis protein MshI